MGLCSGPVSRVKRHLSGEEGRRVLQRVRLEGGSHEVVSQAGAVLLAETVRWCGPGTAISAALAPWRKPRAVHDPSKILLNVGLAVALGDTGRGETPTGLDAVLLRPSPRPMGEAGESGRMEGLL